MLSNIQQKEYYSNELLSFITGTAVLHWQKIKSGSANLILLTENHVCLQNETDIVHEWEVSPLFKHHELINRSFYLEINAS